MKRPLALLAERALCHVGLTRWYCPQLDATYWGETREVQWNDYVYRVSRNPE